MALIFPPIAFIVFVSIVSGTSLQPVLEMVSGNSRIFSGDSVKLKCSIPDVHKSSWSYLWFRGSEQLPGNQRHLILRNAHIEESGKFYCQGVRDELMGKRSTLHSNPVEIAVDGGWAILQVPHHPSLVGDTLKFTCHVRGTPKLNEVILYKDGVEIMSGRNAHLHLTNATLEDQGMYSCRASWDKDMLTHSVASVNTPVQVLEILSQPVLELDDETLYSLNILILTCHHQYNAPAPAPPITYYFYKDNNRLGTATSENNAKAKRTPGRYRCKAKVAALGLLRWSEPKSFEPASGRLTSL
ncbi:low affinity immunoglobulin gamma Fc region receptor III-A-like [Brachionichthys hirsutus]|uniref:low affinity immunoglobulin gamma Fc region receptor III-A-like n=1 Tax=Brachionichthys hirsutus TaxID=412623 RepID=UPI0036052EA4